jgi:hypothetical protein
MNWEPFLGYLLAVALSGVGSFTGFLALLPTKIGQKALDHHFDAKVAVLKHEHSKDLGRLQSDLDHLKDRGTRSNEAEYLALATVWEDFVEAYYATAHCVGKFRQQPDLEQFDDQGLIEFLTSEGFIGADAKRVIGASDKNTEFALSKRHRLIYGAGDKIDASTQLMLKKSVFIPAELTQHFQKCLLELNTVRMEQFIAYRGTHRGAPDISRSSALVGKEGEKMFLDLRNEVRRRLLHSLG